MTMTTADWALVISIISALISLAAFVWNIWSTFIYPKAKVRVSFGMVSITAIGSPDPVSKVLALSVTNMGPGEVTLNSALIAFRGPLLRLERFRPATNTHQFSGFEGLYEGACGRGLSCQISGRRTKLGVSGTSTPCPCKRRLSADRIHRLVRAQSLGASARYLEDTPLYS
jgi:hypothetical protein